MCGGITHQDEIIGGVLVVAGCIQGHHPLQKRLRRLRSHEHISVLQEQNPIAMTKHSDDNCHNSMAFVIL